MDGCDGRTIEADSAVNEDGARLEGDRDVAHSRIRSRSGRILWSIRISGR